MKKLIIICLMALIYTGAKAQSPTKQQTIDWIMNQTGKLAYSQFMPYFRLMEMGNGAVALCYPDHYDPASVERVRFVNFSKITGINYSKKDGNYFMTLTGDFGEVINKKRGQSKSEFWSSDNDYLVDYYVVPNKYNNLMVTYAATEDEFVRIKKAYEHLAKLCGANLISDDLFKN